MKRLLLLAALMLAVPARAGAPPVTDWSRNVETVTVVARLPGPLVWRATKGDAAVYLIGVAGPVPKDLVWNDASVSNALKGARQLLLQAQASVGLVEGLWFLTWHSDSIYLPDGTPMESTLPAGLRTRFAEIRTKLHRDADRYSGLRAPLAALKLEGDWFEANKLVRDEPSKSIERLARRLGVPVKPLATYEALPMLRALPTMPASVNEACVRDALDDIDTLQVHAAPAAKAWAEGDLDGIRANFSEARFNTCVQAVPEISALFARAVSDSTSAIEGALKKPGKTVMLVSIGVLLRKGGILDRLEASGTTVIAP